MTTSIYTGGNFYVYLITDLNPVGEARYYIGSRTAKHLQENNVNPEDDPYMGSSYDDIMIQGLKERPDDFEKIIIEFHDDSDDCVLAEEWFQRQHFAVENEEFFNGVYANRKFTSTPASRLKASKSFKITINDPIWKETIGKRKVAKRNETINSEEWQATKGEEARRKRSETMSDPEWQATKGEEARRKRSETMSDPEWQENVGRIAYERLSKTRSDPEWKNTIGKEAIAKMLNTRQNVEWKETVGHQAKMKRQETVSDPEWKNTIGKEATRKGVKTSFGHRRIGFRHIGPFITVTELVKNILNEYSVSPSISVVNKAIKSNLNQHMTKKMIERSKFLQMLTESENGVLGKTWSEIGFYYYEV